MKMRHDYKPEQKNRTHPESGNVLFFILIAVVLFGALSYVVGGMMRGGNAESITEERARILASGIMDYGRALRQGIQNMRISNGCTDSQISFDTPSLSGYNNPDSPDGCKLFTPAGGDVSYTPPLPDSLASISPAPTLYGEWYFTGGICAIGLGQDPASCSSNNDKEIVAFLPYINLPTCIAINNALGIDNPGGSPPVEGGNAWPGGHNKFTGDFAGSVQLNRDSAMSGCFDGGSAATTPPRGTYHFFQILTIR